MKPQSFGEFLIQLLEFYGVEFVLGIPGVHTAELYRGLKDSTVKHITPRHEQGAGFAADGYARMTGNPGVCLIITGPGLSNTMTAMGQAYADSIPMLVISSVNKLDENLQSNGHLHQLPNQSAMAEQAAEFSYTVTTPSEIIPAMARAFAVFEGSRPRPVHLEIPLDLMKMQVSLELPKKRPKFSLPEASSTQIETMANLCQKAKNPIILAGGGARAGSRSIRAVAERLGAPVVMTVNARGLLSSDHPLAVNATASSEPVRQLIEKADLILALGTELGPTDYDIWQNGNVRLNGKLIRVDISQQQMNINFAADLAVLSDVNAAMSSLLEKLPKDNQGGLATEVASTIAKVVQNEQPLYTRANQMISAVWDELPNAIIVGDSTQPIYAGNDFINIPDTGRWFNSATGFGTLGYGLPAAIGAKRGAIDRPVIAIAGDGGVQFSIAELATAKEAQLPLTLLLWDNASYGEIRNYMEAAEITPEGVDLWTPDFELLAKAYGWEVARVSTIEDLKHAVRRGYDEQLNLVVLGVEDINRAHGDPK